MLNKNSISIYAACFLIVGFFYIALAENGNAGIAPLPPCPCDTEVLSDGTSGNDIVEQVCPGGNLGENSVFQDSPEELRIALEIDPNSDYEVSDNPSCTINTNGAEPVSLDLTDEEFELCRERLTIGCGFGPPPPAPSRNVPTLSEWGLIAMAGLLGIVGFMVIRRRQITV